MITGLSQKSCISNVDREESIPYIYSPSQRLDLEKWGTLITCPKDFVILEPKQKTKYCYLIKEGAIASYENYSDGRERIFYFQEKNSMFLEANLMFDQPSSVGYKTLCKCQLVRLDKINLMAALKMDFQMAMDVMKEISFKYFASIEQLRHTKNHSISWKICDLFLNLAEHYGIEYQGKTMISKKVSQQTISDILGINRITSVRIIKNLKEKGFIEQKKGFYWICDVKKMMEYQNSLD